MFGGIELTCSGESTRRIARKYQEGEPKEGLPEVCFSKGAYWLFLCQMRATVD